MHWIFSSSAYAIDFAGDWTNINDYAFDLSAVTPEGLSGGVDNIDFIQADGFGIVLIDPTAMTFTEYIVYGAYKYTGFTEAIVDTAGGIGVGYDITFALELSGTIDTMTTPDSEGKFATEFTFTTLQELSVYLDNLSTGTLATDTDYFNQNLENYVDGTEMLSGTNIVDGGWDNAGSFAVAGQGSVTTAISIEETLDADGLILDSLSGGINLDDVWDLLAYAVDGDFTVLWNDTRLASLIASYDEIFSSFDPTGMIVVPYAYRSDIDADLGAIPEPATMFLFGLGLLGCSFISRRKNN